MKRARVRRGPRAAAAMVGVADVVAGAAVVVAVVVAATGIDVNLWAKLSFQQNHRLFGQWFSFLQN